MPTVLVLPKVLAQVSSILQGLVAHLDLVAAMQWDLVVVVMVMSLKLPFKKNISRSFSNNK